MVRWQDTVQIEHDDRKRRIREIARKFAKGDIDFAEKIIKKHDLPASFGTDIPVLRVVFTQSLFFDTDRDALRPEAEGIIDLIAAVLRREAADTAVFVAGHTTAAAATPTTTTCR